MKDDFVSAVNRILIVNIYDKEIKDKIPNVFWYSLCLDLLNPLLNTLDQSMRWLVQNKAVHSYER
jgi:hypothetical protein